MMQLTDTVKHLIIINVIFFIAGYINPNIGQTLIENLALHYPKNPDFKLWQLVTHMFLHGGAMHLFFNMFGLAMFGSALEYLWGRNKFLVFYFVTGIGAALVYTLVNYLQFQSISGGVDNLSLLSSSSRDFQTLGHIYNGVALGASGALYGVLVAFAFKYPDVELSIMFLPIGFKAKYFVPAIVALDLFFGLTGGSIFGGYGTGIAHFAHVGGALFGYLLMLYFRQNQFKRWD